MSLISLAEKNNLPSLQLMDKETLGWIKSNKPNFSSGLAINKYSRAIKTNLLRFSPPDSWFQEKNHISSLHGRRHILRVIANASYLAQENKISSCHLINKLLVAASLHDLRRKNDKGDPGHGQRVVEWLSLNKSKVCKQFHLNFDEKDFIDIKSAILLHEAPYDQFDKKFAYAYDTKKIIDLLKSADALDRYRLPKIKWWINDKYLALSPSDDAKKFAYELVLESESNFLKTKKNLPSVLSALNLLEKKYGSKQ